MSADSVAERNFEGWEGWSAYHVNELVICGVPAIPTNRMGLSLSLMPVSKISTILLSVRGADVAGLIREYEAFRRFLIGRLGSTVDADAVLQRCLARALKKGGALRSRECVVAWFHRVLLSALADHFSEMKADAHRVESVLNELSLNGAGGSAAIDAKKKWDAAVRACFLGLLPGLPPRYAELIRRIDLDGELKVVVAHDLKLSGPQLNLVLHRARSALRRRLENICQVCSQEGSVACAGARQRKEIARK